MIHHKCWLYICTILILLACGTLACMLYMRQMHIMFPLFCFCYFCKSCRTYIDISTPKDVTYKISFVSMWQTNGNKQSEFLVDFISTKWSSSFRNVEAVLDFADIKRFVRGYRRWKLKCGCWCNIPGNHFWSLVIFLVRTVQFWLVCNAVIACNTWLQYARMVKNWLLMLQYTRMVVWSYSMLEWWKLTTDSSRRSHAVCYLFLRSLLIDLDLVQPYTKFKSMKKDRREYVLEKAWTCCKPGHII
jgi:hypothetical protein